MGLKHNGHEIVSMMANGHNIVEAMINGRVVFPGKPTPAKEPNRIRFIYKNTRLGEVVGMGKNGISLQSVDQNTQGISGITTPMYRFMDNEGGYFEHKQSDLPKASWFGETGTMLSYEEVPDLAWTYRVKYVDGAVIHNIGNYTWQDWGSSAIWYRPENRKFFNGYSNVIDTPYGKNLWFLSFGDSDINVTFSWPGPALTDGSDVFIEAYCGSVKIHSFKHRFPGNAEYQRAPDGIPPSGSRLGNQYFLHESGFGAVNGDDWLIYTTTGRQFDYMDYRPLGIDSISTSHLKEFGIITVLKNQVIQIITKYNVLSPYNTGLLAGDSNSFGILSYNGSPAIWLKTGASVAGKSKLEIYSIAGALENSNSTAEELPTYAPPECVYAIDPLEMSLFSVSALQLSEDGRLGIMHYLGGFYFATVESIYCFDTQLNTSVELSAAPCLNMQKGKWVLVRSKDKNIRTIFNFGQDITFYPLAAFETLFNKIPSDISYSSRADPNWAHFGNDFYTYKFYHVD